MEQNQELLEFTRHLLDLQAEKKKYNKEINESIKETQAKIKELAKEPAPTK